MKSDSIALTATSSALAAVRTVFSTQLALLTDISWAFRASLAISKDERAACAAATNALVWAEVAFNNAKCRKIRKCQTF